MFILVSVGNGRLANDKLNSVEGITMTTVFAVYEGGVLRPAHPLPFAEGETVEVTVAKPQLPPFLDEWERRIRAAKSIQEWVALANACPNPDPDFDVVNALNETRRLTGFRLPEPESNNGGPV